jgi:hypothetical protein
VWTLPLILLTIAAPARAERDWHVGVNLRTDLGTHPLRVDGGVRLGRWDLLLVLDPLVFSDGQHDADLIGQILLGEGRWALWGGWRPTTIALSGGYQLQEKVLLGVAGGLPPLWAGRLRAQWGFELSMLLVKHGAGLPTEAISFSSARVFQDHINFGMFVRFEYVAPF